MKKPAQQARHKTVAQATVPQSREEANAAIFEVGDLDRQLQLLDTGLQDALAKVKQSFELQAEPLAQRRDALIRGLEAYAAANRASLTENGKVKFASFPAGKLSWRLRPSSVGPIRAPEAIIAWLKENGLSRFIRVKEEVNKEALLAESDMARDFIPGIRIASGGEDFSVEPFTPDGLECVA